MKKVIFSNTVDTILSVGISLESMGVNNWALSRQDALQALSHFVELQIPILGGDVCEFMNEVIKYNYDNWYCERKINETLLDYVERSAREAKNYIERYPDKVVYFSLFPGMNGLENL